ncbi:MAG TPA: sodium/solute symporter [Planctomycetaceae bacterium]|nr:sodium/solute symporter [Planctomycetaceae bacterium]
MGTISLIDYGVVALYLVATLIIGMYVGAYVQTGKEFFLAGRTLPWWAIGFSLVATDIGGTDVVGVGGAAYHYGIAVSNFEWIGCVPAMIVAAFVFIPHFWRCGVTTIPEYLERRFNVGVRTAVAVCWVAFMACNLGVMLLASAKLMAALAGWPFLMTILLVVVMVLFYTWSGGLAAVVYTDVLQGSVMVFGCLLAAAIGVWQCGGIVPLKQQVERSLAVQQASRQSASIEPTERKPLRNEHFSLVLPVDTPSPYPWPGILFGLAFIISPSYWIGNQAIVQRALGARSEYEAKASYVWGALLKNVIPFAIVIPGLIALARFPDLSDPDQALPKVIGSMMPPGMKGIFLAAFLAALMSSVDSYLNSAATIVANDFYLRFVRPNADERRMLQIGRLVTIVIMMWGVGFALWFQNSQSGIYTVFQTLMSFFNGPALAVLLAGLLTKQATGRGALIGFVGGVATSVTLYLLNHDVVITAFRWQPLFQIENPFLYCSIWSFAMTVLLTTIVSYASAAEPPEKQRYALGGRFDIEPQAGGATA